MTGTTALLLRAAGLPDSIDVDDALARADSCARSGDLAGAADVLDEAAPFDRARVLPRLRPLLDALSVVEHGVTFRYVPAGRFLMGDDLGEPDERPAHVVELGRYWMSETPLSQAFLPLVSAIRQQPLVADDLQRMNDLYRRGLPVDEVPLVGVRLATARTLASLLPTPGKTYRLPTEAEWERAARGCRRGAEHVWGDEPANGTLADFGSFPPVQEGTEPWIRPMHERAPNDYGLFCMAGTVWTWCADGYDAQWYSSSPVRNPLRTPPAPAPRFDRDDQREHVLRGGSWADDDEVLRVAFRGAASAQMTSPTIGVRVVRVLD